MLYNKDWEKTHIKPDVFSLEALIAWLEKQPADEEYDWRDVENCMCAQYFGAGGDWSELHHRFEEATGVRPDSIAIQHPRTFGAALDRARKALAER